MALLLAASAAKRRLPILTSFYARLRSSTCYFERRDEEKIYRDGEKIYGAPPEDLENEDIETCGFDFQSFLRGRAIPAPCISETKCYKESDPGLYVSETKSVSQPMTDICFLSYDKDEYPYFSAYSVDEEDGSMSPKYYIYPPSPIKQHGIFLGATCNGVFHFMNVHDEHIMWNLTTNECKILPMSFDRRPLHDSSVVASGMWYDHTRENYKLLQFVWNYPICEEDEEDERIWLYSLKSNSWEIFPRTNFRLSHASTCINDVFYCGASVGESKCIVSFNFSTQTLSKIHLPLLDKTKWYQIMEYKGLLSIVVYSFMFGTNREPSEYELWVMNDGLWSRESVFHVCGVHEPVWFSRNGRFVYFESFRDEVVVFDRATGKSRNLGIHCYSTRLKIYPLAESFVQLNGVSVVEDLEELVRVEEELVRVEEEEDDDYGYLD